MKKEFEIKITETLNEEELSSLLSGASDDRCGFDYWEQKDDKDYKDAKAELIAELKAQGDDDPIICIEDIWARMLFNGKSLMLLETECDEDDENSWHELTLDKVIEGLQKYFISGYWTGCKNIDKLLNEGDFWDYDAVFQYAIYGEVIYG